MTEQKINKDLTQMTYEQFQAFMQGVASLYSNVNFERNYISLFSDLNSIAKRVERLPSDLLTLYGAYEIEDKQVVLAVFRVTLDKPMYSGENHMITAVEVSFAEDERNLQCSAHIREYLTQADFVVRANIAYPPAMEAWLWEKDLTSRKSSKKTVSTESLVPEYIFDDDIPF
ncbi:hypothetical protein A6046_05475 [[Haemophilus] ducreyi]|uniref:hypothetical protein n=1 Tax=Haemophilus ducreyi TaxID=730 RepID=UPI0007CDD76D|nr:hypothetical protein [[Haemophilus] ducreyi]ANF73708.1 hypothetical protein A6045_04510 [[Haemophilus] ducreyi]ANF75454.1 hypothetical protein A6046_05475 [[Haemophilus] ducreyi]